VVVWDAATLGAWQTEIDGADVVINLTGRSVNCRYTAGNREEILQSRVLSTRLVGEAIGWAACRPRVWLQASATTIYAHRYDGPNDEQSEILGGQEPDAPSTWRFSIDVARAWERAFDEAVCEGTRKIALRSAMTLTPILAACSTRFSAWRAAASVAAPVTAGNSCRGFTTKTSLRRFDG